MANYYCKVSPTARCVPAASAVCKDIDICNNDYISLAYVYITLFIIQFYLILLCPYFVDVFYIWTLFLFYLLIFYGIIFFLEYLVPLFFSAWL
jgi:hypothetical protein